MARVAPIDLEKLSAEQREVADAILAGPRGGLRGPFPAWLISPQLCDRAQRLGEFCRYGSSLPADLSELAITITGARWKASVEFIAHSRLALEAGISPEVIEALRVGAPPPFAKDSERIVYDLLTEHFATNRVSDATYRRAVGAFGERGVVDLVGIVGYYCLVAMTLNVFEIGLPEGQPDPFAP
jgi:4-carboxymuconolactone decarboxylase